MARTDAGLTISELAKRAGVSRDTISNAERGAHSLQAPTLNKLARALGRTPSELLAEEERLAPKAPRRSPSEPSLFIALEEERRADWDAAVHSARQLREHGQARAEELLALWRESKDRKENPAKRQPYLDELGELLQQAYDAGTALLEALSWPRLAEQWPEVQAADSFYGELWKRVAMADLSIRTGNAQEERPEAVEEPEAA
jgi:transcriptional regulator with XRE-family HTH domain